MIGFFGPKILIPRWLLAKLSEAELQQIVLHETGHLRRSDDWMNLVQKLALVVFPLNPTLLWVERKLCFERELACDDGVLRQTQAPKAYATCLATLAEHRMGRRGLALSLGALGRQTKSELERRVRSILDYTERTSSRRARMVMGVAMAMLIAGTAELARCPELVSFAPVSQAGVASMRDSVIPSAAGAGYVPVAFHVPDGRATEIVPQRLKPRGRADAYGTGKPVPLSAAASAAGEMGSTGVGTTRPPDQGVTHLTRVVESGNQHQSGLAANGARVQQIAVRQQQWLVVTTWSAADGARFVMTTATVPAPRSFETPAEPGDMPGDAPTAATTSSHPYAAVPVRDGWLVIQL